MGSAPAREEALSSAIASLNTNPHYLQAIANMAQQREVVAVHAICSANGQELLAQGTAVDGATFVQRIGQQRLLLPLEQTLRITPPCADIAAIRQTLHQLRAEHPLGRAMARSVGVPLGVYEEALQHMHWPLGASFRMTLMREQMPQLYTHSVLVMMTSLYLGVHQGLQAPQCAKLAAAALLHDVGMLYLPASWMDAAHKLSAAERRQLTAHPLTGSVLIQSMGSYPHSVSDAVLEHHEYHDASGYPRQLQGADISAFGSILAMAEVVAAFYDKYADMAGERLSLLLRLHPTRFAAPLVPIMVRLLPRHASATPAPTSADALERVLRGAHRLSTALSYWASCKRVLPPKWHTLPGGRAIMWMDARLGALELSLAESGCHGRHQHQWRQLLEQEPELAGELDLVHHEALWQLESAIYTCLRRWPQLRQGTSVVERALWTWLSSSAQVLGIAEAVASHAPAAPTGAPAPSNPKPQASSVA